MKAVDILLAILVPTVWGLGFTIAKAAFVYVEFPPILLMAFRFSLTALVLVWFVKPPLGMMTKIFWIAVISATLQYSLTFTGLYGLDASTAVIIVQLEAPFLAILATVMLKDRLGARRTTGMILAFLGVVLTAGEPETESEIFPIFLVAGGAFVWSVGQIMVKNLGGQVGGFTLIAWVAVFAAPQLMISSWMFEDGQIEAIKNAGWIGWGTVAYMGLVMTALGYAVWYHLLGKYQVNQVMPFLLLVPVSSIIGSILILGESLNLRELIGSAIVIIGVWIITSHQSKPVDTAKVE